LYNIKVSNFKYLKRMSRFTDEDLKVAILVKLWRRKCIRKVYLPVEVSLSKIPTHERGQGKKCIEEMVRANLVELHKRGNCISIRQPESVKEFLKGKVPDYYL